MRKVEVEVGGSLDDVGASFVSAWKAAEGGQAVEVADRIVFRDWGTLCAVLTPKRYELLRALHRSPAEGVRSLARTLDRDVKRVHSDVVALEDLGLVVRSATGLISTVVDEISSMIKIAA